MRIIYALELRQTEAQDYRGFKMFEIFGRSYEVELTEFLGAIKPELLALFKVWIDKAAEANLEDLHAKVNVSQSNDCQLALSSVAEAIDPNYRFLTKRSELLKQFGLTNFSQLQPQHFEKILEMKLQAGDICQAFIETMEMILIVHEEPEKFFDALAGKLVKYDADGLSNLRAALMNRHEQAVMVEIENT